MKPWIRNPLCVPEVRIIVLRYRPSNPKYAKLEEVLSKIPNGKQTEILLGSLIASSDDLLERLSEGSPRALSHPVPSVIEKSIPINSSSAGPSDKDTTPALHQEHRHIKTGANEIDAAARTFSSHSVEMLASLFNPDKDDNHASVDP